MDWEIEKQSAQTEVSLHREDLLTRYKRQLKDNKARGENIEKLIKLLEENPQTLEIMQLMGRI